MDKLGYYTLGLLEGVEIDVARRMNPQVPPIVQGGILGIYLIATVLWGAVVKSYYLR